MKRRQAIQNIALLSAGFALFPACDTQKWPVLDYFPPLEPDQKKLLNWLTDTILPLGKEGDELIITPPEPTAHYVLTIVDDCFNPRDIQAFIAGMDEFYQSIVGTQQLAVKKLTPEESYQTLMELVEDESLSRPMRYFLEITRKLAIRHFTSSEYFMKNNLRFEFAPGRFNGCVEVSV